MERDSEIRELRRLLEAAGRRLAHLESGAPADAPDAPPAVSVPSVSEDSLQRIVARTARIGGWTFEPAGSLLEWSDEVRAIHEVPDDFVVSFENAFGFLAPEWHEWIGNHWSRLIEKGVPFEGEFEIVTATGRRRWIRSVAQAVRDDEGRIVRVEGAFQDISGERDARRLSEARFRQIANSLPLTLWSADADGTIDFTNRAFERMTGDTVKSMGKRPWTAVVHPDDAAAALAVWRESLRTGSEYHNDFRVRSADGSYRWHTTIGVALRDDSGAIVKWYGVTQDVHERVIAEHEAAAVARRLQRTMESISDGFLTVDREWRFTFVNARAARLLQRDREALLGRPIDEALDTLLLEEFRRASAALLDGERSVGFERYFPAADLHIHVTLYPAEDGGLIAYLRDVTERVESMRRLAESEARFRAITRAATDVVWDWSIADGEIWWSEGLLEMFGHPEGGTSTSEDTWLRWIHPDDRERVHAGILAVVEQRREQWFDSYRFEHADGSYRYVEDRGQVVFDAAGEPVRIVGGVIDVTPERLRTAQIREQAALLDQARDAIIVRDREDRVRYWNRSAERIYGFTAQEAIGKPLAALLHDDVERYGQATDELMARGHWRGRLRQLRRDGTPLTVEADWARVTTGGGAEPDAVMAIHTDISAQILLEEQLRQTQRLESIGKLTGGIAHDFNNLLTIMLGNAELLKMQLQDRPNLLRLAGEIENTAGRAAELTRRLLAFARKQPLAPTVLDVNRQLAGMQDLLRRTLGEQVELELVRAAGLWPGIVDASQLENAVLNLCINARDAMRSGGKLTLETANAWLDEAYAREHQDVEPGQYVMVAVSDTGTGMEPAIVERAFDPFFSTKGPGGGSGLGLSMVYGFAKQSGGHVKIYSEPGEGTTVRIYLPRGTRGEAPRVAANGNGAIVESGVERILVVEDDDLVRAHLAGSLERLGYTVATARHGVEGLALLERDPAFDLLLTDVVMPGGMSGRELADAACARLPALRVLFTSGYTENSIVHQGRLDPGVHLLNKPFREFELAAKVRRVLDE